MRGTVNTVGLVLEMSDTAERFQDAEPGKVAPRAVHQESDAQLHHRT